MKHHTKLHQWQHVIARCDPKRTPKRHAWLMRVGPEIFRANHRRGLELRETWKKASVNGVPTRVKFTRPDLKKWAKMRDENGRIKIQEQPKATAKKRDYKATLAALLAWLENGQGDGDVLEHAKAILA